MAVKINGEVKYEGTVVGTGSTYMGDGDSYYWALVFNGEDVERVTYGSTYGPYDRTACADAGAEIIAKVAAMVRTKLVDKYYSGLMARYPKTDVGDTVEVVRGRKVPIGTVATIKWMGPDRYDRWTTRIGIIVDDKMVFTTTANVERKVDEQVYIEMAQTAWAMVEKMDDASVVRSYYGV